jgi:cytochrome c-type biogenesis protein CcmH/NrfF
LEINKRIIAVAELVLIFPAMLFMTALFARHLQLLQYKPAHTARGWTLWLLLIDLPLAVLVIGCVTLLRDLNNDTGPRQVTRQSSTSVRLRLATRMIAAATLAAGAALAVVAVHMLLN